MAEAGRLNLPAAPAPSVDPVTLVRIGIIAGVLVFWELIARSGLLYRDVVPSLLGGVILFVGCVVVLAGSVALAARRSRNPTSRTLR